MTAFHAPVDDILFSLIHVARADRLPGWDSDLAREITGHFAGFAEERIAPLDATGDAEGCRLENGRVRMPAGFAELTDLAPAASSVDPARGLSESKTSGASAKGTSAGFGATTGMPNCSARR